MKLVRLEGFEPPTYCFVGNGSIQLSYNRIKIGGPCRTRTYNIQFRRLTLYPVELRIRNSEWCCWRGLNSRPLHYQWSATTTELQQHYKVGCPCWTRTNASRIKICCPTFRRRGSIQLCRHIIYAFAYGVKYFGCPPRTWTLIDGVRVRSLTIRGKGNEIYSHEHTLGAGPRVIVEGRLFCHHVFIRIDLAFCWQAIYVVRHFGLDRLKRIIMSSTDKFFIALKRIHPYHRPFFFYSALQARSDLHCKRKTPRTWVPGV